MILFTQSGDKEKMIGIKKYKRKLKENVELMNIEGSTEQQLLQLIQMKNSVSKDMYARYLRNILQSIRYTGASAEIVDIAFEGVKKKDIMSYRELLYMFFQKDPILIYRGTGDSEKKLRTSWTINREIAENCSRRHKDPIILTASVKKQQIYAFFANGEDEVIIHLEDYDKKEKVINEDNY